MHPNDWEARRQERWERRRAYGPNPFSGVVFGLLLIGGGLLYLLNNLEIIDVPNIWRFWPAILLALGVSKLIGARHTGELIGGLWLTGVGAIFMLEPLGIMDRPWRLMWPAMLIIFGIGLLLRNLYGPNWFHGSPPPGSPNPLPASPEATPRTPSGSISSWCSTR